MAVALLLGFVALGLGEAACSAASGARGGMGLEAAVVVASEGGSSLAVRAVSTAGSAFKAVEGSEGLVTAGGGSGADSGAGVGSGKGVGSGAGLGSGKSLGSGAGGFLASMAKRVRGVSGLGFAGAALVAEAGGIHRVWSGATRMASSVFRRQSMPPVRPKSTTQCSTSTPVASQAMARREGCSDTAGKAPETAIVPASALATGWR